MTENVRIALDIGGTLVKVVCLISHSSPIRLDDIRDPTWCSISYDDVLTFHKQSITSNNDLRVQAFSFPSTRPLLVKNMRRILNHIGVSDSLNVKVTGGGAVGHAAFLKDELGIVVDKVDEMCSLVTGLNFVLTLNKSFFTYDLNSGSPSATRSESERMYPLLLVNIGSGVSIIKVESKTCFKRVSGTALGGGTALGLARYLIGCSDFDELLKLSSEGCASEVDFGLHDLMAGMNVNEEDTLAASLGRLTDASFLDGAANKQDFAQSIIKMISYNIGYLVYLVSRHHRINKVYFSGKFVHNHPPTMEAITSALEFYKRNWGDDYLSIESRFLVHEGYLGALGSLVYR